MLGWVTQLALAAHHEKSRSVSIKSKKTRVRSLSIKIVALVLRSLILLSVVLIMSYFAPKVYYKVFSPREIVLPTNESASVMGGEYQAGARTTAAEIYQPQYDASLPSGNWLIIDQIGVRTPIRATQDLADALTTGVWMAPDYGRPGDRDKPIILAAHRFGYKWWWKNDYWKKNSFYKLPELRAGSIVKIIADHREWQYEVYRAEEGDEITDYDADLILYTCKFLNSPIRHIRYARLINPTKDSQAD
jgi:sortase (surface protein transpeptidase)